MQDDSKKSNTKSLKSLDNLLNKFLDNKLPLKYKTKSRTNSKINIINNSLNTNINHKLLSNWPDIIGKLEQQTRIEKVYKQTIILGVYDTAWLQELYFMQNIILKKINTYLGKVYFTNLKFKYVNKHKFNQNFNNKSFNNKKKLNNNFNNLEIKLNSQELHSLEKVSDSELSSALKNFLIRCHREKTRK